MLNEYQIDPRLQEASVFSTKKSNYLLANSYHHHQYCLDNLLLFYIYKFP